LQPLICNLVSIGFETNGKGWIGYIVELPGAFIRGQTADEALTKVALEVNRYLRWSQVEESGNHVRAKVVQAHKSKLAGEDGDNEILLDADTSEITEDEFRWLEETVLRSGRAFLDAYRTPLFKDWVDESRRRETFYGPCPQSINEIFDRVNRTRFYYLSRAGLGHARERLSSQICPSIS
jgi:hypothetical protein